MKKKHINKNDAFDKKYSNQELQSHINKELDNLNFIKHCDEVAKNLNIDPVVVKELLTHNSFLVLSLIQFYVLKNKEVKINITGYFSFVTTLIKYKITHLRKITKGKTY
jgi:hypothetical protein